MSMRGKKLVDSVFRHAVEVSNHLSQSSDSLLAHRQLGALKPFQELCAMIDQLTCSDLGLQEVCNGCLMVV